MKHSILVLCVALLVGGVATAVEVRLRDGTVIDAENYRVTGSYVMLELADGRKVAYDVADVDLDALRAQEAAAAAESGADAEPQKVPDTISGGRSLKNAATVGEEDQSALAITDRDVKHVRGSGVRGDDEQGDADTAATAEETPEGVEEGGSVLLSNIRVDPLGEGQWSVQGTVTNRDAEPVLNVTVKLQAQASGGGEPWSGEVPVTSYLAPDGNSDFSHSFAFEVPEGGVAPRVQASVTWMRQETRREPDYTTAGGVPHPSNLPLGHGGVSGADVRQLPTPIQ